MKGVFHVKHNAYIEHKMKDLSSIYRMYNTTEGEIKIMWCNKWYQMVRKIAAEIKKQGRIEAKLKQNYGK